MSLPFARRSRYLRMLAASLVAGALYDAAFAALFVFAPLPPARLLALPLPPLPQGVFYLWILAVLLLMLAALYLLAAHDPRRYAAIVVVAACGRIAGGIVFLAAAARVPGLGGLLPLAAVDLGLGLAHGVLLRLIRT